MYVRPSKVRRRGTALLENFVFCSKLKGGGLKVEVIYNMELHRYII